MLVAFISHPAHGADLLGAQRLSRVPVSNLNDNGMEDVQGGVDSGAATTAPGASPSVSSAATASDTTTLSPVLGTLLDKLDSIAASASTTDALGDVVDASAHVPASVATPAARTHLPAQLSLKTLFEAFTTLDTESIYSGVDSPRPFTPVLPQHIATGPYLHPAHDTTLADHWAMSLDLSTLAELDLDLGRALAFDMEAAAAPMHIGQIDSTLAATGASQTIDVANFDASNAYELDSAAIQYGIAAALQGVAMEEICPSPPSPAADLPNICPVTSLHNPTNLPLTLDPAAEYALLLDLADRFGFDKAAAGVVMDAMMMDRAENAPEGGSVVDVDAVQVKSEPVFGHDGNGVFRFDGCAEGMQVGWEQAPPPLPTASSSTTATVTPLRVRVTPPTARKSRYATARRSPSPSPSPSSTSSSSWSSHGPNTGPIRLSRARIKPPSSKEGRTFVCATCGWAFKRPHNLTNHEKTHKAAEERAEYRCGSGGCQKTFTRPYDLARHERVHTGDKPYGCGYVASSFALG
ncbi:hypothetical protein HDU93_000362, partial [Gonapodya sp. JEL0774]